MATVKKSFLDNMQKQDAKMAAEAEVLAAAEKVTLTQVKPGPGVADTFDSVVVSEVDIPFSVNKPAKKSPTPKMAPKRADKTDNIVRSPADLVPVIKAVAKKPSHSNTINKKPNIDETDRLFSKGFLITARHQGAIELATIFEGKDRSELIREAIEVYLKKYFDSCDNDGKPHIIMSETNR